MISSLRRAMRRLRHKQLHSPVVKVEWVELGSDYGGWPVAVAGLPQRPVIYSFGVGEDISFDLQAIARFGAIVHAFDPTPRSRKWLDQQPLPSDFHFHPVGIAARDGQVEFFPPADERHVSFSNAPSDRQQGAPIVAEVRSLASILRDVGGSVPDILKMDIEGFEYEVIESLVDSALRPSQLLIEFHHGMYSARDADTQRAVEQLHAIGYRLFFVSETGREYGFVLSY
ncbi:FkbM family methyltransferase [uncultured Sphingomonas sp.]|uniref:FkbM family methyltransferase n=1 Tax=uncultured Sphingomonas sp. TaxID=158754 RepID=UPI0035CA06A9